MRKRLVNIKSDRQSIMMYTVLLIVAIILIIGTLFNWSFFQRTGIPPVVHFIVDQGKVDYSDLSMKGMNAASQDLDMSLFIHELQSDSEQLFGILRESPDVIIIGNYTHSKLEQFLQLAHQNNIPVLFSDYKPRMKDVISIGVDQIQSGEMAVEQLTKLIGSSGHIAIVGIYKKGERESYRMEGIEQQLSRNPHYHEVDKIHCEVNTIYCQQQIKQLMLNNKLDGIIALDVASAITIAKLKQLHSELYAVQFVTFDRTNALLEYVQDGIIDSLLVHNAFNIGYLSIQYSKALTDRGSHDGQYSIQPIWITKDNMYWAQHQKLLFPVE